MWIKFLLCWISFINSRISQKDERTCRSINSINSITFTSDLSNVHSASCDGIAYIRFDLESLNLPGRSTAPVQSSSCFQRIRKSFQNYFKNQIALFYFSFRHLSSSNHVSMPLWLKSKQKIAVKYAKIIQTFHRCPIFGGISEEEWKNNTQELVVRVWNTQNTLSN